MPAPISPKSANNQKPYAPNLGKKLPSAHWWAPAFTLFLIFVIFTIILSLQKPVFCIAAGGYSVGDCLLAMAHGLSMDMSIAGYLSIVPALLVIAIVWVRARALRISLRIYFLIASLAIALGSVSNAMLYPYWGFPLDTTPLFYFASSPSAAMASVTIWQLIGGVLLIALITAMSFFLLCLSFLTLEQPRRRKWLSCIATVIAAALLFIPIRGGITVSTMNLSRAYFSSDMRLNHAAIDPLFSLLYSASHSSDYSRQFRFMDTEAADSVLSSLVPANVPDSLAFKALPFKPNVQIIILESFSSRLLPSLGGEPVALNLDNIARQSIVFDSIYASSFRTDRALTAILNGYPAQPNASIMKHVSKLDSLPAIGRSLRGAGYSTAYYYGGDANFTNMNALLVAGGYDKIVSDKDFPMSQRLSKWGAHDEHVFARALADWLEPSGAEPRLAVVQTSSSHEPFDVPGTLAVNNCGELSPDAAKRIRAFAYADSCLGEYMRQLSSLSSYDSTLVVIIPDHYGAYPEISDHRQRHLVPLIIAGGATRYIEADSALLLRPGSQTDIAATVLALCGVDASKFGFSHNLLDPGRRGFAYFSEPSWIAMALPDGVLAEWSVQAQEPIGSAPDSALALLQAYVQHLYDDIANR